MNKTLIKKVIKELRKEPSKAFHFDMSTWVDKDRCGTMCCIAGEAMLLTGKYRAVGDRFFPASFNSAKARSERRRISNLTLSPEQSHCIVAVDKEAAKVLGLTPEQGMATFLPGNWPTEFQEMYDAAYENSDERGKRDAGIARLEHLLATGE